MPSLDQLMDTWRSLPLPERQIMQVLAFFMAPVSRTTFAQCLQKASVRLDSGRAVSPQALAPLLQRWKEKEIVAETQGGFFLQKLLRHPLLRQLEAEGEFARVAAAIKPFISGSYYKSSLLCLQDLQLAIYLRNEAEVARIRALYYGRYAAYDPPGSEPFGLIFNDQMDADWIKTLPANLAATLLTSQVDRVLTTLNRSNVLEVLDDWLSVTSDVPLHAKYYYVFCLVLQGRLNAAQREITRLGQEAFYELSGVLAALRGDDDAAISLFDRGLARIKKDTGKRKVCFLGPVGIFHLLALVRSGLPAHLKTATELASLGLQQETPSKRYPLWLLSHLAETKQGNNRHKKELEEACRRELQLDPFAHLVHCLIAFWLKTTVMPLHGKILKRILDDGKLCGFHWLAGEAALLNKAIHPQGKHDTAWAEELFNEEKIVSLSGRSGGDQDWQRSLKALLALGCAEAPKGSAPPKESRLIWLIYGNDSQIFIQPIEQKQAARGWTRGRNIALKRLAEDTAKLDFLTPQDRKAAACIRKERSYGYYSQTTYEFDTIKTIGALIGHPLVFNAGHEEEPLSVAKGEFTLEVLRTGQNLNLTLTPLPDHEGSSFLRWEGTSRLVLYEPSTEQRRIASIIGDGLTIPKTGEKEISAAITAISPHVIVHSDVAGELIGAETVEADNRLHMLLRPFGAGVSVEVRIRPFGQQGPLFFPGRGGATVIAEVQGKKLQCLRNHALERERFGLLMNTCDILDRYECQDDFWRLEEPEATLELLEKLHEAIRFTPDAFVLQWPEGERFKLRGAATWERLKLSVRSGKEWFCLTGEVSISEDEVLSLQQLLELAEAGKGRYIQLAEGEFVALTNEFRRRLDDLSRVVDRHGKEQRFHPLLAPLVDEALGGPDGIKGDKLWKSALERFRSAEALKPALPTTLQASLRDYQHEGFDWLSRLAYWGVGACLADDMGLGKTVQALALLINRAPAGPSLVLAPTSVCLNWESEARRFAPTLQPRIFGAGNRTKFVESLQPFDLVICSYTLFQQEAELLTAVRWETAVLDEAQAIKNMATKRSQAAMQINAGFRLATTGTPVENRLDEIWNLFRFLNPGLLGSKKTFTERFSTPIERDQDKTARALLKKLIRPFILRRTKSQVLEELPPRTDIVHRIELSGEEAAFYEALRRKALDNLQGSQGQPPGERQIRILAEIMRLRQACCNPQLVLPDSTIASAKLAAFREIVDELRENGHRALVFSQFVGHLALLRKELDRDGIGYQYLDGATPTQKRQEQVAAFQAGQGELFLISLKAGGSGLNLTAADYVIHMDPWWNPAVEDQASDRAHRIGQQRPVTVYRLVAANTIEEKIVALHGQKRDLADSLLEGTETAARVSAEDLLELLRETGGK